MISTFATPAATAKGAYCQMAGLRQPRLPLGMLGTDDLERIQRTALEWLSPELGTVVAKEQFRHHGGKVVLPTPVYSVDIALKIIGKPIARK